MEIKTFADVIKTFGVEDNSVAVYTDGMLPGFRLVELRGVFDYSIIEFFRLMSDHVEDNDDYIVFIMNKKKTAVKIIYNK